MNTEKLLKYYRLTEDEYCSIKNLLGHIPSRLELALFSAMWSEHCSYKSSALHLKKLFFESSKVLSALGENAGVVDLGQGEKVAFKIESHNHPSQITPYHGAATGVGGILRDVFVMNARPMALANYLCFGEISPLMEELVDGVVKGIGGYGNSIGIPNITGQTEFHSSYTKNIIVNALALGYFGPDDKIMSSKAKGLGNLLVYVGARTGRDGVHGASMASESFKKDSSKDNKTCVQIGDPFYGKLLMESCLSAMKSNLVIAAQDMGAAGLISSSFEMISKGGMGMRLHLDKVPLRDASMTPEEILLSESQERVLLLIQEDNYKNLKEIFNKWGLPACVIGELIEPQEVELFWKEDLLLKINPQYLTEQAPRYRRSYHPWQAKNNTTSQEKTKCFTSIGKDLFTRLHEVLSSVEGCSRKPIYRQYDQRVGASTVKDCSFPIGVIRLPHSGRALGLCTGGRPHIMRMDSLEGGKDGVYEPALQLAIRGFTPLALTDGLNFGSPEREEVMSSFVACVDGMAEASRSLETPVVSGNVSLYNETEGKGISPTPATAMIGIKDSLDMSTSSLFSTVENSLNKANNAYSVYLLSCYQIFYTGLAGELYKQQPAFKGVLEANLCKSFIHQILKANLASPPESVYLVGKFGLAYTLARILIDSPLGMKIKTDYDPFQERLYEIVLILKEDQVSSWKKYFFSSDISTENKVFKLEKLGQVIKENTLFFNDVSLPVVELRKSYKSGWNKVFH